MTEPPRCEFDVRIVFSVCFRAGPLRRRIVSIYYYDYCIYDNSVAFCLCSWRGIDCAGSKYGKFINQIIFIILKSNKISLMNPSNPVTVLSDHIKIMFFCFGDKM